MPKLNIDKGEQIGTIQIPSTFITKPDYEYQSVVIEGEGLNSNLVTTSFNLRLGTVFIPELTKLLSFLYRLEELYYKSLV